MGPGDAADATFPDHAERPPLAGGKGSWTRGHIRSLPVGVSGSNGTREAGAAPAAGAAALPRQAALASPLKPGSSHAAIDITMLPPLDLGKAQDVQARELQGTGGGGELLPAGTWSARPRPLVGLDGWGGHGGTARSNDEPQTSNAPPVARFHVMP